MTARHLESSIGPVMLQGILADALRDLGLDEGQVAETVGVTERKKP